MKVPCCAREKLNEIKKTWTCQVNFLFYFSINYISFIYLSIYSFVFGTYWKNSNSR